MAAFGNLVLDLIISLYDRLMLSVLLVFLVPLLVRMIISLMWTVGAERRRLRWITAFSGLRYGTVSNAELLHDRNCDPIEARHESCADPCRLFSSLPSPA